MNKDNDHAPDETQSGQQQYTFDIYGRRIPVTPSTPEPSRCYMIGTSKVHVQPGCRCKHTRR